LILARTPIYCDFPFEPSQVAMLYWGRVPATGKQPVLWGKSFKPNVLY
jgi:hypothetical protein